MSFGKSVFAAGFNQKTIKEDLSVKANNAYPPRNQFEKTLENSRGQSTEAGHMSLICGAGRPHCQVA